VRYLGDISKERRRWWGKSLPIVRSPGHGSGLGRAISLDHRHCLMKETVSHHHPKVIKKLQFSLLNPQDVVKLSEFQVTHRELYTAADRLPVKDGVLDRRLVLFLHFSPHFPLLIIRLGDHRQKCVLRDLWSQFCRLCRPLRVHKARCPCVPHWIL